MAIRKREDGIEDLAAKIRRARIDYYAGTPKLSDDAFDALEDRLRRLDPEHPALREVGAAPAGMKFKHWTVMGSQNKVVDLDGLKKWWSKNPGAKYALPKWDGASVTLYYRDGKLSHAVTRGNGSEGENITPHVLRAGPEWVPPAMKGGASLWVRAEAILKKSTWEKHFPGTKNPRNCVSGILGRKTPEGCEHIHYLVHDARLMDGKSLAPDSTTFFVTLLRHGFVGASKEYGRRTFESAEDFWKWFKAEGETFREEHPYEMDGFVLKPVLIPEYATGETRPSNEIAVKFPSVGAETVLRRVDFGVGKTGKIPPVGYFDPVVVGGAEYDHATLDSLSMIRDLGLHIGDRVLVVRRNDVIPKIEVVVEPGKGRKPISIPTECPDCRTALVEEGANLYCRSENCGAQVYGRIMYWVKTRNILEIGEAILSSLMEAGLVERIDNLYDLSLEDISRCVYVDSERAIGEKVGAKVLENLRKSRTLTLVEFLGAVGIPGFGVVNMEKIVSRLAESYSGPKEDYRGYGNLVYRFLTSTSELSKADNMGPIRVAILSEWVRSHREELDCLAGKMEFVSSEDHAIEGPLNGLSFCFTGTMPSRSRTAIQNLVRRKGGEVKSSVTKGLSYLVAERDDTAKAKAAMKYGTKVVNEEGFDILVAELER